MVGQSKVVVLEREQRYLVILSLAKLSHSRPGWINALREVAGQFGDVQLFDDARLLGPDKPFVQHGFVAGGLIGPCLICSNCMEHAAVLVDEKCDACRTAIAAGIRRVPAGEAPPEPL